MSKCPNCGYCEHCGRSAISPGTPLPYRPYRCDPPWWEIAQPSTKPSWVTTPSTTITMRDNTFSYDINKYPHSDSFSVGPNY